MVKTTTSITPITIIISGQLVAVSVGGDRRRRNRSLLGALFSTRKLFFLPFSAPGSETISPPLFHFSLLLLLLLWLYFSTLFLSFSFFILVFYLLVCNSFAVAVVVAAAAASEGRQHHYLSAVAVSALICFP